MRQCDIKVMANHKLHVLRKVLPLLTPFAAQHIYKVMILPLIEYGSILYEGSKKCLLTKLQTVQNKCLKLAHYLPPRTPTADLNEHCKTSTLVSRRRRNLLTFAYRKVAAGLQLDIGRRATRAYDGPVLKVPKFKKKQPQRAVEYRCAVEWNMLPTEVRNIQMLEAFNKAVIKAENHNPS